MTAKKDFKALVRERMAQTGESYTAARAQLLSQAEDRCPGCHGKLVWETVWAEPDEDATDGQNADYNAAIESDELGEWGVEEAHCPRCESGLAKNR